MFTKVLDANSWSWKRISYKPTNRFHPENVNYCQDFLNYMSTIDLYCIKSFDEAGFKLPDFSKPYYGHAPKGLPCIETGRHLDAPSVTLQLPIGLDGIMLIILVQLNFLTFSSKL